MARTVKSSDSDAADGGASIDGIDLAAEALRPVEARGDDEDADGGLELDAQQSEEIRQIFGTTLPQYLLPVEEMVGRLLSGTADDKTGEALLGTLSSLRDAASRMGFESASGLMEQLSVKVQDLLEEAQEEVPREAREGILGDLLELKDLAESMGGAADPDQVSETLFKALEGMQGLDQEALGKLSAAGVLTVSQLREARPDEVAAVTGLELEQVHQMLRHVSGGEAGNEAGKEAEQGPEEELFEITGEAEEAGAGGGEVVALPLEVEPLRKMALQKLREQVDAEAALDELKAEVRRLRARVQERKARLRAAGEARAGLRDELERVARSGTSFIERLEQARQARDDLARRFAVRKEELHLKEQQLRKLYEDRRKLVAEQQQHEEQVRALLDRMERLRRRAAGGKSRVE
jgi:hypothetical protein